MSELRGALIVGCGRIAGGYNLSSADRHVLTHALAYHRHPAYELKACVDPDPAARARFMAQWNVPSGYGTLDEALACGVFDIASVCSPTGTHLAALAKLFDARIPSIFAEKPLDGAPNAALVMASKFREASVPVAVNFLRRYDASMRELRSDIAAGRHGKLRSIVAWYSGGVMDNGSHQIDIVHYLTGIKPALQAVGPTDGAGDDPAVSARLDVGDAPFQLIASGGSDGARHELELAFDRAVFSVEDSGLAMRQRSYEETLDFPGARVLDRGSWRPTGLGSSMLNALDELSSWSRGKSLSSDMESACVAISLAVEIRRRSRETSV